MTELRGAVSAAKSAWERDLAVKKTVEQCNQLRASHQLAETLKVLEAGLVEYEQEPALVRLEREVREQWQLEQRAEAVRRSAEEGQRLLDQGRTDLALEALEKAFGQYPEAGELQQLVVRAQQRREGVEQAALQAQNSTEQRDFERAVQVLEKALDSWPRESRLEELLQNTEAARASWQRDQAIQEFARECSQLQANHQLAEALELIASGLKKYEQEPILLRLEQEVREQWAQNKRPTRRGETRSGFWTKATSSKRWNYWRRPVDDSLNLPIFHLSWAGQRRNCEHSNSDKP